MSADQDGLIRTLRAPDLADDIPGRRVLLHRRRQQQPDPDRPACCQPLELLCVGNGKRRCRNLRRPLLVIESTGMWQTVIVRTERTQQIGDRAPLCGLGRTGAPDPAGRAIAAAVLHPHHALGHDGDLAVE